MPDYKNMAPPGTITVQEAARRLWQEHLTGNTMPDGVARVLRDAIKAYKLVSTAKPRNRWYVRRFVRYVDVKAFWIGRSDEKNEQTD